MPDITKIRTAFEAFMKAFEDDGDEPKTDTPEQSVQEPAVPVEAVEEPAPAVPSVETAVPTAEEVVQEVKPAPEAPKQSPAPQRGRPANVVNTTPVWTPAGGFKEGVTRDEALMYFKEHKDTILKEAGITDYS